MSNQTNAGGGLFENLRSKTCLQCGSANLAPFFAIEQETSPSFEYLHTIIAACAECGRGQLERTYNDSSDSAEVFDQTEWFLLNESSMERLHKLIEQKNNIEEKFAGCMEPLSPKCLCGLHWQLTEASKRLEPLSDEEIRDRKGVIQTELSVQNNFPQFVNYQRGRIG